MNYIKILFFVFISQLTFAQIDKTKGIFELLRAKDIEKASQELNYLDTNSIQYMYVKWELQWLKNGKRDYILHEKIKAFNSKKNSDNILIKLHLSDFYISNNDQELAYDNYSRALRMAKEESDSTLVCKALYHILQLFTRNHELSKYSDNYIKEYKRYANTDLEKAYAKYYQHYFKRNSKESFITDSLQLDIQLAEKTNNNFFLIEFYQRLGVGYDIFLKKPDSAVFYYTKVLDLISKFDDYHFIKQRKKGILNNLGCIFYENQNYKKSVTYFNNTLRIQSSGKRLINDSIITRWLIKNYEKLNKLDSTIYYFKKIDTINKKLNQLKYAAKIDELNKKYNLSEKEKKIVQLLNTNLKTEAGRVRNRNLLIGSISFIAIGLLVALLLYKNIKRKQRIAEQQREIEIQKTEKLLKEQELTAIDAMISGQEKERQRLANDLHDNLGSTLATVKLHFQHLRNNKDNPKIKNIEELYAKTDTLLDEAYQKVRTIAHEKNSGVMANQGLLLAIKNLAKKVSNGKHLQIEIQDYGLEERLDNALEISIFRMIQELITNTIKHANATEIHISLTNHDSLLNIIVEDNGKGFDAKVLPQKDGMGLATIEKRIEHLEGTFEVDSTIDKGTNIIINIPI